MEKNSVDFTNTFSDLTYEKLSDGSFYQTEDFKIWYKKYRNRLKNAPLDKKDSFNLMHKNNPYVIPRNHNVEYVINESMKNNYLPLFEILSVLKKPYKQNKVHKKFTLPANESNRVNETYCGT